MDIEARYCIDLVDTGCMGLALSYEPMEMPLEFPFTISRGSETVARTVLVEIKVEWQGSSYTGLGEAVPSAFYGETPESVASFYDELNQSSLLSDLHPFAIQVLTKRLEGLPGNMAAKAGIDMAMYDLQGKITGLPLYQLWGLDPGTVPDSSYTIGIADLETMRLKTQTALSRGYTILKVKLGTAEDEAILAMLREEAPGATIRADVNAGWTVQQALGMGGILQKYGVEFIEEPLVLTSCEEDYRRFKDQFPVPVMADESCKTLSDIPRCARLFHAINLKHTKTGGLTEATRMIHAARAHGLKIMLGGFCESSLSVTAFAHLSPLVDYADLDAALLLAKDPFSGITFTGSQYQLPNRPGIGAVPGNG